MNSSNNNDKHRICQFLNIPSRLVIHRQTYFPLGEETISIDNSWGGFADNLEFRKVSLRVPEGNKSIGYE